MRVLTLSESQQITGGWPTLIEGLVVDDVIIGFGVLGLSWSLILNQARARRGMPLYSITDCALCMINTAFVEGGKAGILADGLLFVGKFSYTAMNNFMS